MPTTSPRANSEREILVAGATGQQGGAVARALLKRGFTVRGLSRDPSKKPEALDGRIHWVQGDLHDARSLESALRGAHGFYVVTTPFAGGWGRPPDTDGEIRAGRVALETAKRVRTPHVVLSTIRGVGQQTGPTGVPHFDSKVEIERQARSLGVPITFVRPSFFMENLFQPWTLQPFRTGTVSMPVKPETKIPMVALKDIGEIVARAFEQPERRIGTAVDLMGDEKTYPEIVELLSRRMGTPARFVEMSDRDALQSIGEDMQRMFRAFDYGGLAIDVAALERQWNIEMTRFEDLLKETTLPTLA
ncbi:MAG: NmrA/HSCARG family protein [Thermoplasmata archaeon]